MRSTVEAGGASPDNARRSVVALAASNSRRAVRTACGAWHTPARREGWYRTVPVCNRTIQLRQDGTLIMHKLDTERCVGSGTRPDDPPSLASWLPLCPGLTSHGLRHGHQTWLDDLDIRYVLQSERMGHEVPGMRGDYTQHSRRACAPNSESACNSYGRYHSKTERGSGNARPLPYWTTSWLAEVDTAAVT